MDHKLKDSEARKKIREELNTSFFVEAGAGSGKTYCLVERMVNLIKNGSAAIEHIAAVTFTRKAAAELNERFQIGLEEALKKDISKSEGDNILTALSNLEQIFIGTIHSFCSKILRERPVEAGVDPGFDEIEESQDLIYAERAWSHYIENAKLSQSSSLQFIQDMGINVTDLKDTYFKFVQYPDVEIVTREVDKPDFTGTKKAIREQSSFFKEVMPKVRPEKGWDKLQEMINKSSNLIDSGYMDSERKFIDLLNELGKRPEITQNRWPGGNSKSYLEKMEKFQQEVIFPALKSWQEYIHKPTTDFIMLGAEYYRLWRRDHSILNFQDLLINTAELLRDNSEVRSYFKKRFTHILVDEFQDTDPVQAEIILFLTGSNNDEGNWKNIIPAPGSLFVVGDPKQSIYRFRRADIDIYNLVKTIFDGSGGEVLNLYSNFRSLPFMQEAVEDVFKSILPEEETRYQARYFPLDTVKELNGDCNFGVMENPIRTVDRHIPAEVARIDAARIANWIKSAVNGSIRLQDDDGNALKPRYSDFLILTKNKKNLKIYARSLEILGIPYGISGGESFSGSFELIEIYRLFRAIEDDRDPVALITALRGMFFGISDDQLYRFKRAGGVFSYYIEVPDGFNDFYQAFKMIKEYREIVKSYEPVIASRMIIEKSGILPLSVCEEEGLTRAGNIFKALELLKDRRSEGMDTFSDLVNDMKELLEGSGIESMSLTSAEESSVRIMNLHKAKGLESPVVILADPMGAARDFKPDHHITRTGNSKALGYFVITKPAGSYGSSIIAIPPDWDGKAEEERLYEEAEKRRLEYVAVTRAKNILLVSTYREGSRPKAWEFMHEYLSGKDKIKAEEELDSAQREVIEIGPSEWDENRKGISKNIEDIGLPSYSLTNVTTETKEGIIFSESAGQGMGWGRIVHKAVELVSRGGYDKLRVLGRAWIEEEGRNTGDLEKLVGLVDGFRNSDLWGRIEKAGKRYFEVPFALEEESSIVYGVIDVVFEEEDGWVIADYKTDDFERDSERKKAYEKQVETYGRYWEKISGEMVREVLLYKLV